MSQRFVRKTSNRLTAAKIPAVPAPSTAILVFPQFVREWSGDAKAGAMIEASQSRRGMSQTTIMIFGSIICQESPSSGNGIFSIEKDHKDGDCCFNEGVLVIISLRSLILPRSHIIIKGSVQSLIIDEGSKMHVMLRVVFPSRENGVSRNGH